MTCFINTEQNRQWAILDLSLTFLTSLGTFQQLLQLILNRRHRFSFSSDPLPWTLNSWTLLWRACKDSHQQRRHVKSRACRVDWGRLGIIWGETSPWEQTGWKTKRKVFETWKLVSKLPQPKTTTSSRCRYQSYLRSWKLNISLVWLQGGDFEEYKWRTHQMALEKETKTSCWLGSKIQFSSNIYLPLPTSPSHSSAKKILPVLTTHSSHLPLPFLEVIAARLPIMLFRSIGIEEPGVGDLFIHGVGEPD